MEKELKLLKKEIKLLKTVVKAQDRMLIQQRTGQTCIPEWTFTALDKVKKFYNINELSKIV